MTPASEDDRPEGEGLRDKVREQYELAEAGRRGRGIG
jgi:hypothetical protein